MRLHREQPVIHSGICGRADLVRVCLLEDDGVLKVMSTLLGYHPSPEELKEHAESGPVFPKAVPDSSVQGIEQKDFLQPRPLYPVWFWQQVGYAQESTAPPPPTVIIASTPPVWPGRPKDPPRFRFLTTWPELQPRLRQVLAQWQEGHEPDVARILHSMERGRLLLRIPHRRRRQWGRSVQVVLDRSEHLVPFWKDQQRVFADLASILGENDLEAARFHEGLDEPRLLGDSEGGYRLPPPGGTVFVLGDLGALQRGGSQARAPWLDLGRRLQAQSCRGVVLFPAPLERFPSELKHWWQCVAWERDRSGATNAPEVLTARAEQLLRLLGTLVRIEPGLLRDVRLALGPERADAGTEADVWGHSALSSTHSVAASLTPEANAELRAGFDGHSKEDRAMVLHHWRRWRWNLADEVVADEIANFSTDSQSHQISPEDLTFARDFWRWFSERSRNHRQDTGSSDRHAWFRKVRKRANAHFWQDPVFGEQIIRLDHALHGSDPNYVPPPGFRPALIEGDQTSDPPMVRRFHVGQSEGRLVLNQELSIVPIGSWLGTLHTINGLITIENPHDSSPPILLGDPRKTVCDLPSAPRFHIRSDCERLSFRRLGRPTWADAMGRDRFGLWVEFVVGQARQKMRWIPPGRFWMGSPEDEPGRVENEGPRHEVTIKGGYWLFDTPCTQALWQAVMGDNPSRFQTPDRPVEQVHWDDVQTFLKRINDRLPGLDLILPSEAQWEYACRAGTTTALYTGGIEILGEHNAPALDSIAWYGGNSGVGFDLDNGRDNKDWPEKQYPQGKAGTHPVGRKVPNPWGLYDMLGNVYEWCADYWHGSYEGAPVDGNPWLTADDHVIRGGSWGGLSRGARAAYRERIMFADRDDNVGFRCARVHP